MWYLILAGLGAASAQPGPDPCRGTTDPTACFAAHQAATLDLFDLPTAEARAAAGDSIRRVIVLNTWSRPVVAIEYRRAPGRGPSVSLYLPRGDEAVQDVPALSAAVPLAEWNRLSAAGLHFDRALVPLAPGRDPNAILVCADGGTIIIEATDPDSLRPSEHLRRRVARDCPAGLASVYADELADAAVRLLPACQGLTPLGPGNSAGILRDCGALDGDRMAAAEVHNLLPGLRDIDSPGPMSALFQADSTLDWNGVRAEGGRAAAAAWIGYRAGDEGARFYRRRVLGETGRRVRVLGTMARTTHDAAGGEVDWRAAVELVFVHQPSQTWQIAWAHVGPFERQARR